VRNLPGVHVLSQDQLNTYDVLRSDDVVFSVAALNAYIDANIKDTGERRSPAPSAEEVSA
jgi:large subunit ribosomal protein L4